MVQIEFYTFSDDNPMDELSVDIIDRVKLDYSRDLKFLISKDNDICSLTIGLDFLSNIDDVEQFTLEEICHETGVYVKIYNNINKKEYYFDEEDGWFYNKI